ncbi:YbjN domain-containing protein [Corynebacterium alimapuense]|uniref:YbjN domain-containing protein n=1 Tax=Corynebacterium alimapuense TaxID=1576874 RepID=A0A3M8K9P6_9CORY|nr:YbjN domain-containing protein [Corynebacterium alimapuense]RNE49234.1 hypothetical protein C5L39_02325 [Corynebacterium alimapuense]
MSNNPADLSPVTIARIVETMSGFGVDLDTHEDNEVATANLNGVLVTFAVLGSVAIVRADAVTEQTLGDADPTFYLAANQVNCVSFGARATVVDRAENLIIRTERDLPIAAGLNDAQLGGGLRAAVDAVLATQDGIKAAAEELDGVRASVEAELAEQEAAGQAD